MPGDEGDQDRSGQPAAAPADVPPEAAGRLGGPAFSSGLSVPDFAACLQMGMRPVGLVQGFCVMGWTWYTGSTMGAFAGQFAYSNRSAGFLSSYTCPHNYYSADHRTWGYNDEQTQINQAWRHGYATALKRMIEEAGEAGAHGVVGVVDTTSQLIDSNIREFHLLGTAVVVDGLEATGDIWTTYLAGQRLAKLFEAGFMPVSVVATSATVRVYEVCVTETLLRGLPDNTGAIQPGAEITQLSDAHMSARRLARDHVRSQLGHDALHGARMDTGEVEVAGGRMVTCRLRGTRVRQFMEADPLPAPMPTVRLR